MPNFAKSSAFLFIESASGCQADIKAVTTIIQI